MDCFQDFFLLFKDNAAVGILDTFPGVHTFLGCGSQFQGHRNDGSECFSSRD